MTRWLGVWAMLGAVLSGCPNEMGMDAGDAAGLDAPDRDVPDQDVSDRDGGEPDVPGTDVLLPDAPGLDAPELDAPVADVPGLDAPMPSDVPGTDSPVVSDADMDGVPTAMDCNDADAAVGRTGMRMCMNACGGGTERCTDGVWGACSAPTDCFCPTEGATRIGACGNCGMRGERCTGGIWTGTGPCMGEGECAVGATEERPWFACVTQSRLCGATCRWGGWMNIGPPGECEPGTDRCIPECLCDDACVCQNNPRCG